MRLPLSISIIGSTGSIGVSTLQVVERFADRLRVVGLAAGRNVEKLAEQARRWRPEIVAIADPSCLADLRSALDGCKIKIVAGTDGLCAVASHSSTQTTVISVVGFAGLRPTLAAIDAGKKVALANKETLVAAGSIVMQRARSQGVEIVPIDSEHSAVWQCLRAGTHDEVARIILTASGGPFLRRSRETFDTITPSEALAHPTWTMGPRITIDSATMMNKGFEIIEAAWLFDVDPSRIDVVIHPQSIVHSFVEFRDGSVIAQCGAPDMTIPIAHALFAPERPMAPIDTPKYDPATCGSLDFLPADGDRFPVLELARRAFTMGRTGGAVLNAADEIAVAAFLDGRISFPEISEAVEMALNEHEVVSDPDIGDIENADRWARNFVTEWIDRVPEPQTTR